MRVLKVARIVILGHAQCGGVQAIGEGAPEDARDFVEQWMGIAKPVLAPIREAADITSTLDHYEGEVVRLSLANLRTFPWIASAVADGNLELHGFRFDIHTGILTRLEGDRFVPVT